MNHPLPLLLIVDDDEDDRFFINYALRELGWSGQAVLLENAGETLDYLEGMRSAQLPAFILLDYHMPRINGETLLRQLKADSRFRDIPVAVYSTEMTSKLAKHLHGLGAAWCVEKSLTIEASRHLARRLAEQATQTVER